MARKGFTYLGKGKGERYRVDDAATRANLRASGKLGPDGSISRRAFNEFTREVEGFLSRADQERLRRDPESTYNQWLSDVAENQGVSTRSVARYNSEFNRLYAEAKAKSFKDKSPDSALARILVLGGYRSEDADYNVGDTP